MTDVMSVAERSRCMRAVRAKDTKPEMKLRRALFALGFRYKLHLSNLPGKPDLVFVSKRKVIFVHGCFWHRHSCKAGLSMPKTRVAFWKDKLSGNEQRDHLAQRNLKAAGWKPLVVWQCELKDSVIDKTLRRVQNFLRK